MNAGQTAVDSPAGAYPDTFEAFFLEQYGRVVRVIASITRDPARAEEIAVEAFLRCPAGSDFEAATAPARLHRTAVNLALDEVRRLHRRRGLERLMPAVLRPKTPEEVHINNDLHAKVTAVLARLRRRDSEILLLRANGLSYEELAAALSLRPASIGTLLSRAQNAFRKEYVKRYGTAE